MRSSGKVKVVHHTLSVNIEVAKRDAKRIAILIARKRVLMRAFPYFPPRFTAALSTAPALNAGTLEALIFSASPVLGLRPGR